MKCIGGLIDLNTCLWRNISKRIFWRIYLPITKGIFLCLNIVCFFCLKINPVGTNKKNYLLINSGKLSSIQDGSKLKKCINCWLNWKYKLLPVLWLNYITILKRMLPIFQVTVESFVGLEIWNWNNHRNRYGLKDKKRWFQASFFLLCPCNYKVIDELDCTIHVGFHSLE